MIIFAGVAIFSRWLQRLEYNFYFSLVQRPVVDTFVPVPLHPRQFVIQTTSVRLHEIHWETRAGVSSHNNTVPS